VNIVPTQGSATCTKSSRRRHRRTSGTTIAEMPVALWIIVFLCFAMLVFACQTVRFGFFWNACREAAQQAAKCQTFKNDSSTGPSAVNMATTFATQAASSFSGLTITAIEVHIMSTNVTSGLSTQYPSDQQLPAAADTTQNIYDIQVVLKGQVEPLIRDTFGGLINLPGLSAPIPVVVSSQYNSEVPQGLNQ
jgi:hypothetical protein